MEDSFYRAFEDRHRGSRELITSRLRAYLPFIEPLVSLYPSPAALDLGCGRGEWLELVSETGFAARGVDLDEGMLAACRERGLRADNADAIETLRGLPANSVALVSAFHVIEHVPFDTGRVLIAEALRVLQPGGLLILETPNPENLMVGTSLFYQDPSHVNPLPPELLSFAVEHAGFSRVKTVRLQESPDLREQDAEVGLFNVLGGVSPDYSVVAQKEAAPEILAAFDDAFRRSYGLTLHTLASRYDQRAERSEAELKALMSQAEGRLARTADHLAQSIAQLNQRLSRAEAQAIEADARAQQLGAQLLATLNSRSWRITAPLRYVTLQLHRIRSAVREGRVGSGIRRRLRPVLRGAAQFVDRLPLLRRLARGVINRFPGLKRRLRASMKEPPESMTASMHPTDLSPRAARMLDELERTVRSRKP